MNNYYDSWIRKPIKTLDGDKLEFMIREWYNEDYKEENSDDEEDNAQGTYKIYLFGCNQKGESICLRIDEFTPYFYVKVPDDWDQNKANRLGRALRGALWKKGDQLLSWKLFKRKDAYGFSNNRKFNFIRLVFSSHAAWRECQWKLRKPIRGFESMTFKAYETSIDPMLVFIHLRDIQASGWINVDKKNLEPRLDMSRCQHNYSCHWKDVKPSHDKSLISEFVTMSFDLECYSHDGAFPDPAHKDNYITQIGSAFQRFGRESEILKTVIVVGECDDIPGVHLVRCKTEQGLLKAWIKLIQETDPDQMIGYNIDDFDWTYIWKRAEMLDLVDYICERLPRIYHVKSEFHQDTLESNAYGFNSFNYITTPGIGQMDLLHWFRKNTKLDRYSLDFVSEKFLGDTKRDVDAHQIFKWSGPNASPSERALVADYCAQDTSLPLRLMENRCMFPNMVEMSRVTYVPFTWLVTRGEQVKAYSQLNRELRKLKFVLPGKIQGTNDEFQGATVLSCDRGYHAEAVSGLDFASLYPSIMIAWNLCPTTWVSRSQYDNLEGIEYKRFETDDGVHTFVQSVEGVVPGVLDRLWKERKVVKRQMSREDDPRMKAILNGKQLAIKVSMNSIYGFFGVSQGVLPCRAIAASVTFTGREMIKHSKDCAESWYDGSEKAGGIKAKVVYGDSVTGDTPLVIQRDSGIGSERRVIPIRDYYGDWESFRQFKPWERGVSQKEQIEADGRDYILTSSGWRRIRRVIRHKCRKKIFRVTTQKGTVFVTQDHSLLDRSGREVKPKGLDRGVELMWTDGLSLVDDKVVPNQK